MVQLHALIHHPMHPPVTPESPLALSIGNISTSGMHDLKKIGQVRLRLPLRRVGREAQSRAEHLVLGIAVAFAGGVARWECRCSGGGIK